MRPKRENRRNLTAALLAALVVSATALLAVYPKEAFEAAADGFHVFLDMVFPSLLPFFVVSELMLGLGVVHGLGVLLEPLMRPLFNVPGVGAFALSMGLAAGYPMDAVITARFRRDGLCTRVEGERLLAFTNTADPLFMLGAVAVGMLRQPAVGLPIALAHYLGSFTVGLAFRWWGRDEEPPRPESRRGPMLPRAWRELLRAREEDGRPLGRLLGDAVTQSMQTLLLILGFIMFFSVVFRLLAVLGVVAALQGPVGALLRLFGFDPRLVPGILSGLFEIDIGSAQVAQTAAPLFQKLVVIGAIVAWSGLSVHGQVAAVLAGSDVRYGPYVLGRLLHVLSAALYTALLFPLARVAAPAFALGGAAAGAGPGAQGLPGFGAALAFSATRAMALLGLLLGGSLTLSAALLLGRAALAQARRAPRLVVVRVRRRAGRGAWRG
ncbi:MAG: sporulation integral membrane protein YlbJ [Clostridia bacterium]|nr:sporulation integral membrane protein YlbJ [Clostridia bacterium]